VAGSTDPKEIEREISGTMLTYLEQAVLYFNLDKAAATEKLSSEETREMRAAVEAAFPTEPAGKSQYERTIFRIVKAQDEWRKFHNQFPSDAPNYNMERDRLANEHVHTILDLQVMYRS